MGLFDIFKRKKKDSQFKQYVNKETKIGMKKKDIEEKKKDERDFEIIKSKILEQAREGKESYRDNFIRKGVVQRLKLEGFKVKIKNYEGYGGYSGQNYIVSWKELKD